LSKPHLRLVESLSPRSSDLSHTRDPLVRDRHSLVVALKRGDQQAAVAFFREFEPLVERTIGRILGYDDELGDATQEAFIRAVGSLDRLRDPQALVDWLIQISVYTATDCLRRRARRRWLLFVGIAPPEEPAAGRDDVAREALRATYRVLDRMRPKERIAFALRFIDGMDIDALANAQDCSRSTAKRRLARAVARFRILARREAVLASWVDTDSTDVDVGDDDEEELP
jgi:RNA polymerase sigma-70 factor, ECF subfamily